MLVELTSEWYKQKKIDNKPILVLAKNMIEWYQKKTKEIEEKNTQERDLANLSECDFIRGLSNILMVIELIGK